MNQYKENLKTLKNRIEDSIQSSNDISSLKSEIVSGINEYKSFIPEFFSHTDNKNKIKDIYKKLKEISYSRNKSISTLDVAYGSAIYREYYNGMVTFIESIIDASKENNDKQLSEFDEKIKLASGADSAFVESLFGGKNNSFKEETLTDAIKNFEYMIDFITIIDKIIEGTNILFVNDVNNLTLLSALKLWSSSVNLFLYNTLSSIIDTYNCIGLAINGEDVPILNTEIKYVLV